MAPSKLHSSQNIEEATDPNPNHINFGTASYSVEQWVVIEMWVFDHWIIQQTSSATVILNNANIVDDDYCVTVVDDS